MIITYSIIGVTVLISMYAFNNPGIMHRLILNPYTIKRNGQYYRFITSGFIHKDHLHLIMNMFSFYFFGAAMEKVFHMAFGRWGGVYFVALYVMAIVISDMPSYLKHKNHPGYNSLGASGGVAAVIFAFIIFQPLQDICIYFALCMPGFILGTLYIVFSYYQGKKANDNINHDAHLYGALFGFLFCAVTYPASIGNFIKQVMQWRIFD